MPGRKPTLIDLGSDKDLDRMNINYVFNVEDLLPYQGIFEPPILPSGDFVGTSIPRALHFP